MAEADTKTEADAGSSKVDLETKFNDWCAKPGQMTTKDMTAMFKQCKIFSKTFTSNSADILFCAQRKKMNDAKKAAKPAKEIDFDCFVKVLDEIEKDPAKKEAMITKILTTTKARKEEGVKKGSVTDRLTDTKGYTGSHKERFDKSGKGRGIDGREDRPEKKGYVTGYKNEGTYAKK